jgi:subfamily B ATP-binding cassette protein HlyB/CyaB
MPTPQDGDHSRSAFGVFSLLPDLGRERRSFGEAYLASLLIHLLGLVTPLVFGAVLDKVVVHQAETTLLALTIGAVLAILFDAAIGLVHDALLINANPKIDMRVSARVMGHALSLPLPFFARHQAGALVRDMQQDVAVRTFLTNNLFFSLTELTALAVLLPVLLATSAALTGVVLGFSVAIALVSTALAAPYRRRLDASYAAQGARQSLLVETLHGIATVKALGLEANRRDRLEALTAEALERGRQVQWLGTKGRAATVLLERLMAVAIIFLGAKMVFAGQLSIGQLVAFQMLAGRVTGPLMYFVSLIRAYQEAAVGARSLSNILEAKPEGSGATGLAPMLRGAIRFEEVSFAYDGAAAPSLDRVSFEIPAGARLGIVGRSGSGKTTLVRLVQGLLSPGGGRILVDGHDLAEVERAHLRRAIGVVPQEAFLFRATVRENIAAATPDAPFEAIVEAAREAGADAFIRRLPDGYDTMLEEGASNLSGGQRQRLAIARALLRRPPILIFDEATSALDTETEAEIQRNLEAASEGRSMILVSHRLAAVQAMEAILVLDRGRVVGFGPHRELLLSCPAYRQLWSAQPAAPMLMAAE